MIFSFAFFKFPYSQLHESQFVLSQLQALDAVDVGVVVPIPVDVPVPVPTPVATEVVLLCFVFFITSPIAPIQESLEEGMDGLQ
jgi:hypothetical protein